MKRPLLAFALGILATLATVHLVDRARRNKARVPPWHPFELRSDLTLDDLVADGYRFSDMPCGMVHFAKTIGDTTIRYHINIDCERYKGKHVERLAYDLVLVEEEELIFRDEPADTASQVAAAPAAPDPRELERQQDPYWPIDAKDARRCHQDLSWRHYWFTMETIDSLAIRRWVEQHGGYMYSEDWNCSTGGDFIVVHLKNNLLFNARIDRDHDQDGNFLPWELTMTTSIPFLDHERYEAHLEREKRKDRYYGLE